MFKALTLYRLPLAGQPDWSQLDAQLATQPFTPCGPTQPISVGFVPPRGHAEGPLVEWVNGHALLKLQFEQRLLPGSVIKDRVDELAEKLEQESGRKPGAKRRRELKDEALLDLLPLAFTRTTALRVWIAPQLELLAFDSTTSARCDAGLTLLSKALVGLTPEPLMTAENPATCMNAWLLDGVAPAGFGIGRDAELRSSDTQAATVRYTRHGLDGPDIQQHLTAGKQVKKLALNWRDRLDFVLTDTLQLTRLKVDDGAFEQDGLQDSEADPFDADALLATAELSQLLPALFEGLGGLVDGLGVATAPAVPAPPMSGSDDAPPWEA
ncbi:recombination-associated protein RdgC [Inhella gelatinilytica]|uniref:Recombination-associated protein RdgC n=1 Tax=Inhella gelatinilytica TaxID=2795030 RepID=A0A931IX33_9BURK|nr:recombination-associated protein RdgC [Inhella gelatinilytica]MBH9553749.1 recombination-associated protein RdgC [Inhella gelatinilytica]